MLNPKYKEAIDRAFALFAPPPDLTVSQWADAERQLSPDASAEFGQWRTDRVEYMRGVMDAFNEPGVTDVVGMFSAQTGKTEAILNVVGYHMRYDPCPIGVVQPNATPMGEAFSKDRVAPMINATPTLRALVQDKSRNASNTIFNKAFPGGQLSIMGANSPTSLRMRPKRIMLFDEVDGYDRSSGSEGDALTLGKERTLTFWNRRCGYFSTPGIRGASRIEQLYEDSDQRKWFIPCPACDHRFVLQFEDLRWNEGAKRVNEDGRESRCADSAWFECPDCHHKFSEVERHAAVKRGEWIASAPFNGIAGFWGWQGMSPWVSALDIANKWLAAIGSQEQMKAVVNTVLARTFQESGDAPDWKRLYERAEDYPQARVPAGVVFLTAGTDVQQNRLECSVWGWGRTKESWLIDHIVIEGSPRDAATWSELDSVVASAYPGENGKSFRIEKMAVDSGDETMIVYNWTRRHSGGHVVAVKGKDHADLLIGPPRMSDLKSDGKTIRSGAKWRIVSTHHAKRETYSYLRLERPTSEALAAGENYPDGYVHIYQAGEEFFRQLCAEQYMSKRNPHGFMAYAWVNTRPGSRNEALDCRVYARAAAELVGLSKNSTHWWDAAEGNAYREPKRELRPKEIGAHEQAAAVVPPPAPPPAARRSQPNWINGGSSGRRGGWL